MNIEAFFSEHEIKGFLDHDEGMALNTVAKTVSAVGPYLEVGSYCGKSTVYLGAACLDAGNTLYAVDHHRGSEEHQLGEEYHDPELYDVKNQCVDSFPLFRRTLDLAGLSDVVIPVVCSSKAARRHWGTALGFVFIDGGHSPEMSKDDCVGWSEHLAPGGILAIHDIFEKPEDGGQGPYWAMNEVLERKNFSVIKRVKSLVFLKRDV